MAHPSLGRQMHHRLRLFALKQLGHGEPIRQIQPQKIPSFRPTQLGRKLGQAGQPGLLEGRIVVGIEVVYAQYALTAAQQLGRHRGANESRNTGYQYWSLRLC
jgi:hypothetical protein